MSLLKKFLEDAAAASVSATNVANVAEPLMKDKKKKKTKLKKRVMEAGEEGMPSFDETDALSKLRDAEKSFDHNDTVGFALEDEDGRIVKVYVVADQAEDFEKALSTALDQSSQSEAEIAEILFDFRDQFDIIDIVWPSIPEDEEVDNELTNDEGGEDTSGDTGDIDLTADDNGTEDTGEDTGDEMTADDAGTEDTGAQSALDKVIDMMKADAEARKQEAEAKKAAAEAEQGKYAAQAAAAKVQAEEETLDMEDYYKKKADEDKEAKKLAKLAKYKHDLAADEAEDEFELAAESAKPKLSKKERKERKDKEEKQHRSLLYHMIDGQE